MQTYGSVSVVIPVYNSASSLKTLTGAIKEIFNKENLQHEIILVNDGSKDTSWIEILSLVNSYPEIVGINLTGNFGQHNALLAGIRAAKYDIIVTLDDDLQHPPLEIPKLLAKLKDGYDVVYGYPIEEKHKIFRTFASRLTKKILRLIMGISVATKVSAFRSFRAELRQAFPDKDNPYVNIDVLLSWATSNFESVPVHHNPRIVGTSNYSFFKLIRHVLNMLTGFTIMPLRFATILGASTILFGLGVLTYVFYNYFKFGGVVPGFAFIASIITIFTGVQLIALGIIGEYIASIYRQLMGKPAYVIREVVTCKKEI